MSKELDVLFNRLAKYIHEENHKKIPALCKAIKALQSLEQNHLSYAIYTDKGFVNKLENLEWVTSEDNK